MKLLGLVFIAMLLRFKYSLKLMHIIDNVNKMFSLLLSFIQFINFLGFKSRLFYHGTKMIEVYWWIGSLCLEPEFYHVLDYKGKIVFPSEDAVPGAFNVSPSDKPVNLSIDGEVGFDEFSPTGDKLKDDVEFTLNEIREKYRNDLVTKGKNLEHVSRLNIYEDFLKLYKKRGISSKNLSLKFEGEDALGDGVTKDAFLSFFDEVYKRFEGETEKVPNLEMDEDSLVLIGKIITHSYVLFGIYPTKISPTVVKYHLFNVRDHDDLVQSFLSYLPFRESETIELFANGVTNEVQPLIDIFSESKIFRNPTRSNVYELCKEAANTLLEKQSFFAMKNLISGMGVFWTKLTPEMFNSVLSLMKPSSDNVIKLLDIHENCPQDAAITTHLHRFLRSLTDEEMTLFLRFTTGSFYVTETDIIKVEFVSSTFFAPKASTCFKILILPRINISFARFRELFLGYLKNKLSWKMHDD